MLGDGRQQRSARVRRGGGGAGAGVRAVVACTWAEAVYRTGSACTPGVARAPVRASHKVTTRFPARRPLGAPTSGAAGRPKGYPWAAAPACSWAAPGAPVERPGRPGAARSTSPSRTTSKTDPGDWIGPERSTIRRVSTAYSRAAAAPDRAQGPGGGGRESDREDWTSVSPDRTFSGLHIHAGIGRFRPPGCMFRPA